MKRFVIKLLRILLLLSIFIGGCSTGVVVSFWGWLRYWDANEKATITPYLNRLKFEKQSWSNMEVGKYTGGLVPITFIHDRYSMAQDLLDNYLKVGMKMEEVTDLLGPTDWRREYITEDSKKVCLQYGLGVIIVGLYHPSIYLVICPDKENELVESFFLLGGGYGDLREGVKKDINPSPNRIEVFNCDDD